MVIFLTIYMYSQDPGSIKEYAPIHPGNGFPTINPSKERLIYRESFMNKEWKDSWRNISKSKNDYNISICKDQEYGNVLKIKTEVIGFFILEKDIKPESLQGKKIMIRASIKYSNIQGGKEDWQKGKLCLKFTLGENTYYEDVQGLGGSEDWFTYYAHEDASKDRILDNTNEDDPYMILIPKNATNIVLYIGLQDCSGEIFFSNILIVEKL
jgi:hypothetical protein